MTSRAELIQQFLDNIFAGNIEVSTHTNKTPPYYQIASRKLAKTINEQLEKWERLRDDDSNSPEFDDQTYSLYKLIIKGRNKWTVHGHFEIQPPTAEPQIAELKRKVDQLTEERNKLAEDLNIIPKDSKTKKNEASLRAYG